MAISAFAGLGEMLKKTVKSAKEGGKKPSAPVESDAMKEARTILATRGKRPTENTKLLAAKKEAQQLLNAKGIKPKSASEVIGDSDFFKAMQKKSLADGNYNVPEEKPATADFMLSLQNLPGEVSGLAGAGLKKTGAFLSNDPLGQTWKGVQGAAGATAKAVGDAGQALSDPGKLIGDAVVNTGKAAVEGAVGVGKGFVSGVTNATKLGWDIGSDVVTGVENKLGIDKLRQAMGQAKGQAQKDRATMGQNILGVGKAMQAGPDTALRAGGMTPESLATNAGSMVGETMVGGAAATKAKAGMEAVKSATGLTGLLEKAAKYKGIGTKLIDDTTNPFLNVAQKTLDWSSTGLPKNAEVIANAAADAVGYSAASEGKLPTAGEVAAMFSSTKFLDWAGKKLADKAVRKFNQNLPNYIKTSGNEQGVASFDDEAQRAIRQGLTGRDPQKIIDTAGAKITAKKQKTDKLIEAKDVATKKAGTSAASRTDLVDKALEKLIPDYLKLGKVEDIMKLKELADTFKGGKVAGLTERLQSLKSTLSSQKAGEKAAREALTEAMAKGDQQAIAQLTNIWTEAKTRVRNVSRSAQKLEERMPFFKLQEGVGDDLTWKDLEAIKQANAKINKPVVAGQTVRDLDSQLEDRFMEEISNLATSKLQEGIPGLKSLFKDMNVGYKAQASVSKAAKTKDLLPRGGKSAYGSLSASDLFKNSTFRNLLKTTLSKNM